MPGAACGEYTAAPDRVFNFCGLRAASKSGAFGTAGRQSDFSCKSPKGASGGVVISAVAGLPATYVKLCAPAACKRTVRVLCCDESRGVWRACALQSIPCARLRAHVVSWCAFVLGVGCEVGREHPSAGAAGATSLHVAAYDKAKKTVDRCRASLKRAQDKCDEAVQAMSELQAVVKKSRVAGRFGSGSGSGCRGADGDGAGAGAGSGSGSGSGSRGADASDSDSDSDSNSNTKDDDDSKAQDIVLLKMSRNLYRKSEEALHVYRCSKRSARSSCSGVSEYKAAKKTARRVYIKSMEAIARVRTHNRDMLRREERTDLLTTVTRVDANAVAVTPVFSYGSVGSVGSAVDT